MTAPPADPPRPPGPPGPSQPSQPVLPSASARRVSRDPRRRERRFVGRKLRPGQPGTKRLLAEYGERLFCVRYRYDAERHVCLTTAEIVVAERPWKQPPIPPRTILGIRIPWGDFSLRQRLRAHGGRWDPARTLWYLEWQAVQRLELTSFVDPATLPKALLSRLPRAFLRSLGSRSTDAPLADNATATDPDTETATPNVSANATAIGLDTAAASATASARSRYAQHRQPEPPEPHRPNQGQPEHRPQDRRQAEPRQAEPRQAEPGRGRSRPQFSSDDESSDRMGPGAKGRR